MPRRDQDFQAIRSEGGLLPTDLLRRVIDPRSNLSGTKPEDYGLPIGERLNEVITQSWNRLRRHWTEFRTAAGHLPEGEAGTGLTNDKWSLPLLRELGFGLLPTSAGPEVAGRGYAISRFFGPVPVHLVGCRLSLDRRAAGQRGAAAGNPHGLVQEFLNRSAGHLWGIVSNGLRLRILRDNQALSRQSFIEFDLEAMFSGEIYADFVLLWLVAHATRFAPREGSRPETCWLEQWTKEAEEQGTRALGDLRGGVERALEILGEGFTSHPKNTALRDALRTGQVPLVDFHGQLLRVVYRFIFLFVAEDRTLEGAPLLHPRDNSEGGRIARQRYAAHYSAARLRDLAGSIRGSRHCDLWRQFQLLVTALSGEAAGEPIRRHLGLPALGSFLWNPASTATLNGAELTNFDLLEALRHLAFARQGKILRPVDYKNLGAEELGGIYESLLALTPRISADGARFTFAEFAGNERRTSGSYYTPDPLVQRLLDSALDPVVAEAIEGKAGAEAEKALLALKVCDPAVGSGHFLVGAAHRLARHLARVRALAHGESEPSPLLYQHALRDVIGRCLYGVDLNPMAAELCRVGLWLEALEPGKPLSFLDHHIRVGNSLLGATPELVAAGLPDDAFTAIEGDNKKACAELKKRNKAERKGLGPLFAQQDAETQIRLQKAAAALEDLPDDRPEDIRAKELAFRSHEQTEEYRQKKQLYDAWCAAFFMKKHLREPEREASASGITQRHLNDLAATHPLPNDLAAEIESLSAQFQFFHWNLTFPEVFARGGFDCVLGNPPWERVKLQEKEWFAERRSDIASVTSAAARKRLIDEIKRSHEPSDCALAIQFAEAVRKANCESRYLHHSGRYPLSAVGDLNTFSIFAELAYRTINESGRSGLILPTGFITSETMKEFFADVMAKNRLRAFIGFDNEEKRLFPEIDNNLTFAVVIFGPQDGSKPKFCFNMRRIEDLAETDRFFELAESDLEIFNPNSLTCPVFRSSNDAILTRLIYRRFPILIREHPREENIWGIRFGRMFDMTNDASLFKTREQLQQDGAEALGNFYNLHGRRYAPLYEAKMIWHFEHRWASDFGRVVDGRPSRKYVGWYGVKYEDPNDLANGRYWIDSSEVLKWVEGGARYLLCYRLITNRDLERTGVYAVTPVYGVGNSAAVLEMPQQPASAISAFVADRNSFVSDFITRNKLAGSNLSLFTLKQLPAPSPSEFGGVCRWIGSNQSLQAWILPRVLELTYTAWDLEPFAQDCGWQGPPFRWDEQRRFALRCELDAALFHLYLPAEADRNWSRVDGEPEENLAPLKARFPNPRDAVDYIMNTFPIVRRNDEEKYDDDYRTKRVILEIYDAMQEAARSGQPYQTRLDPPPGPPIDANGKFVEYSAIAANPPPHIHLSRGHASTGVELHLSDLARGFPTTPFVVRLGAQASARRIRVIPVSTAELRVGERVILAAPALRVHGDTPPAAIGKLGIESRSDASSDEHYVLVSVRGDAGVAQARLSEAEWKSLTSVGRVEDLR